MLKFRSLAPLLFVAMLSTMNACQKETVKVLDFSTITYTDSLCNLVGDTATENWTYDNSWVTAEFNLLAFKPISAVVDTTLSKITVLPACPNPNNGQFTLRIKSTKRCKLNWVMVNRGLEILAYSQQKINSGQFTIPFDFSANTAFDTASNYRMYYGFYNAKDSLYYKGHGNIRWQ